MHEAQLPIHESTANRNARIREILDSRGLPVLPFEVRILDSQLEDLKREQDEKGQELYEVNHQSSETWHDNHAANEIERYSKVIAARGNNLVEAKESVEIVDYPSGTDEATLGCVVDLQVNGRLAPLFFTGRTRELAKVTDFILPPGCLAVTIQSPLGEALLGKKLGETVSYTVKDRQLTAVVAGISELSFNS